DTTKNNNPSINTGSLLGQLQGITYKISNLFNLRALIIMRQNYSSTLLFQFPDFLTKFKFLTNNPGILWHFIKLSLVFSFFLILKTFPLILRNMTGSVKGNGGAFFLL